MTALRDFLLAPNVAPLARPTFAPPQPPPPSAASSGSALGLLAPARELCALGAAVALAAADHRRSAAGLLCLWTGDNVWAPRGVALPVARRLAARLVGRGHPAVAAGRLAIVALVGDPDDAAHAAADVLGAADAVPTVVAIALRAPAFDSLLRVQDAILVTVPVGASVALADLALDGVTGLAPTALRLEVVLSAPARALARAGLVATRPVRAAVAGALT